MVELWDFLTALSQPWATLFGSIVGGSIVGAGALLGFRASMKTRDTMEKVANMTHEREVMSARQDKFTKIGEQLSNKHETVRLAGVYALAALADEWQNAGETGQRDVAVKLLCAYLRASPRANEGDEGPVHRDAEVRAAVVSLIRDHTSGRGEYTWPGRLIKLTSADLLGADLRGAGLRQADLSGANLSEAQLQLADLSWADLRAADLSGADLSGANLPGSKLEEATLTGVNLDEANLLGARLRMANLTEATLWRVNLSEADLSKANLSGKDLSRLNLWGAGLRLANLSGADLSGAELRKADLTGANLSGANLSGANLSEATLWKANLTGANLTGVNRGAVDLSEAIGVPEDEQSSSSVWPGQ